MVRSYTLAALCAASIPMANAGVQALSTPPPEQPVVLRAIVEAGTTSVCGMREAPHLIEHLLLSDTSYGVTPVDAILTLRAKGITLSAQTRSDFTEYTLEGPADIAELMSEALVTFLSRPSIPKMGFEREKRTIIKEVKADDAYVSSPTLYERFIAAEAAGRMPCPADSMTFLSYDYDAVQEVYEQLYTPRHIKLLAQATPGTFDLDAMGAAISKRATADTLTSQDGSREPAEAIQVLGRPGLVELIFPIAGRSELPSDAANALADQARLEVQAHIRRTYQLYTARTFVDQSIEGGWIRLEVPELENDKAPELLAIAESAMGKVDTSLFHDDVIWKAYGSVQTEAPVGAAMVAELPAENVSLLARIMNTIWDLLSGWWS